MPHSVEPKTSIRVVPIVHTKEKSNVKFAAEVYGVDLNNFSDEDFKIIEDALHLHKLLIFKEQPEMLSPQQQYKLTSMFDTNGPGGFAHAGDEKVLMVHNGVEIKGIPQRIALPCQPEVHVLGRGRVPPSHYQLPDDLDMVGATHPKFHLPPHIPKEDVENGASRFYQWHFDAALYDISPPRVGCLLAVRTPKGPDCTVRWEDDEGKTMTVGPVDVDRSFHSSWPYLATEGLEMPVTEDILADGTKIAYEASKLKTYPMVWTNPKTGEKSLQVHGQAAWKLYLKDSPEEPTRFVDDLKEVRQFMDRIMRPAIVPSNIYAHHHSEQDVVLWYNRALWHSITEFPDSYGPRIMHQCNVAASDDPM
ncbi:hypothetical protein IFR04_001851 [Cadophora malorum]|uniref:TauD/TfdA-like domain-containing protein n=1 Tax=Cadophora malorum TaxID=108018 RepID=A0A8H7WHL8_9HELO|nr:hypothetical protein IFR04_001851 [Cadophora malorum]